MLLTMCVCVSFFALKNVTATKDVIWVFSYNEELENERAEMRELMSEVEADSKVLAYNMRPYFYIETDMMPCYKNFTLQDWQTQHDKELRNGFEKDLKSLAAEYIVVQWPNENRYQEFIDENYSVTKDSQKFRLYRLNEKY